MKIRFSSILTLMVLTAAVVTVTYYHRPEPSRAPAARIETPSGIVLAEDHFSPDENLERLDLEHLQKAQRSVDIAMYAFTDKYLAEELARLAERGVVIRIYRDREQFEGEQRHAGEHRSQSTSEMLRGMRNVSIRVKPSGRRDLMHLKAYVVDGSLLRDGSANWSAAGLKEQDNNVRYTTDPAEIRAFQQAFAEMWARPGNQSVE